MKIHLLAIGQRLPSWVEDGYQTYARRLPRECSLILRELPAAKRNKSSKSEVLCEQEAAVIEQAIPKGAWVVALDEGGQSWSSKKLSQQLDRWMQGGRDVALLVGGPDGLSPELLQKADQRWSLSPLTLPHGMVRVFVAEQIYRAWSLIIGHPYHRE